MTQRPFQLGSLIQERGQIAGIDFRVTWKVVEYERPTRVILQCDTPSARITYTFQVRGVVTDFRLEIEYEPAVFRTVVLDAGQMSKLMHAHSEEALSRLKTLVERILREKEAG